MSIGNYEFWVILEIREDGVPVTDAVFDRKDARQALRFRTHEAALDWIKTLPSRVGFKYWPVRIRA